MLILSKSTDNLVRYVILLVYDMFILGSNLFKSLIVVVRSLLLSC